MSQYTNNSVNRTLKKTPKVSIVVVNYNGENRIAQCITSILSGNKTDIELIIIDNCSTDNSLQLIKEITRTKDNITLIESKQNLGYAGGINLALQKAQGEYFAIVNMDLKVTPNWLTPLVSFLEMNPHVGAITPLVLLMDSKRVNAAGQNIHVTGLGSNRSLGESIDTVGNAPFPVQGIHGCAFVVRTQQLKEIGGIDDLGFLYHEDVNLSWLLRMIGFEIYCEPSSRVYHDYFLTMYPTKFYLLERNRIAMLLVYLEWFTLVILLPFLAMTEAMAWGYALIRGGQFLKAKFRSYKWVIYNKPSILKRRKKVKKLRKISDWQILKELNFQYNWRQFITLGLERGKSAREPTGGLATKRK